MADLYDGEDKDRAEFVYNNVASVLVTTQYGIVEFKGDHVRMTLDRGGVGGVAMYEWVYDTPVCDVPSSSELIVVDCSTPTVSEEEVVVDVVGEQA